jgi:hypothetical protein
MNGINELKSEQHRSDGYMKRSEAFPSHYVTAEDLNGREHNVVIDRVDRETFGDDPKPKPVVYFKGRDKGVVLNGTRWDSIVLATGREDSDEWAGCKIVLYPGRTPYKGKMVPCVAIKTSISSEPLDDEAPF